MVVDGESRWVRQLERVISMCIDGHENQAKRAGGKGNVGEQKVKKNG